MGIQNPVRGLGQMNGHRVPFAPRNCLRLLAAILSLGASFPVLAQQTLPSGGTVTAGVADIGTPAAGSLEITQSSDKAIIDWSAFSIGAGNTVTFANGSGATLNRVTGATISSLDGVLSATGSVYLVNANGIIVGQSGIVDVGGSFIASTHDVGDNDFLTGGDLAFSGSATASVINLGAISSTNGDVALIARDVRNEGTITAPNGTAALAAGYDVLLTDGSLGDGKLQVRIGGSDTLATNTGSIEAAEIELRANGGNIYALAGNTDGQINATGVANRGGRVFLTAGSGGTVMATGQIVARKPVIVADAPSPSAAPSFRGGEVVISAGAVTVSGEIDVSGVEGGAVSVTGTDIVVNGEIDASATIDGGTGGEIVVFAENTLDGAASLSARGGDSGQGGFVETSGATVDFTGFTVDTSAQDGTTGTWLIDPEDIIVDAAAAAVISTNLATTSVTLQTTASGASAGYGTGDMSGDGDIIVNSGISWSSGNILTLDAYNAIAVNATITVAGSGGVVLNYDGSEASNLSFGLSDSGFAGSIDYGAIDNGGTLSLNGDAYTLIYTMAGLDNIDTTGLAGNYAQATDLDATGITYTDALVGISDTAVFTGNYQGLGHTISELTINKSGMNAGLFGVIGSGVTISNIGLVNASVTSASSYVGALVGYTNGSTISNAYATGDVTGTDAVGGLVGWEGGGIIENSFATSSVEATTYAYAGGLVGWTSGTISNSYATGAVTGDDTVGGLAGRSSGAIKDSFATGKVTGSYDVGGLVGYLRLGTISNSYATGSVTGDSVGGLVGYLSEGTISDSYATGAAESTGNYYAGGLVGDIYWGTIENSFATGEVTGSSFVGGLVGDSENASITNSYATGGVSGTGHGVGGLVGRMTGGTLEYSYATGEVSGHNSVGGLVGESSGTISNSHATGTVSGGSFSVGGLVGESSGAISNSHATGTVSGSYYVGGLVGESSGTIGNSYATGAVTGYQIVGGLVGYIDQSTISDSYATGTVSGTGQVGGLVGALVQGTIGNSYATGNVSGAGLGSFGGLAGFSSGAISNSHATGTVSGGHNAGGLVGTLDQGTISNSYATGTVSGDYRVGGLVGTLDQSTISDSYATGTVSGMGQAGGLVGWNSGTIGNSFWNTQTSGQSSGCGANSGTCDAVGLTSSEMQDPFTFIDAGWEFETVWGKSVAGENGGYMMLRALSTGLYDDYVVVSGDTSRIYGDVDPAVSGITLTGVGTGNVAVGWGSAITPATNTGSYLVSAGNVLSVITSQGRTAFAEYGTGTLTINPAALTISANNDSKTYDGAAYSGHNGLTYSGFKNNEDTGVFTGGSTSFGGDADGAINAGTYTIDLSGDLAAANYDISYVDGTLTVNKAALTVTANNDSKTYDGAAYSGHNGLTYSGFKNNEDTGVFTGGSTSFGGNADGAVNAGTYTIDLSGDLAAKNYDISYVDGTLTVNKAALTVTANNDSKTYDGVAYSGGNGISYSGFINGESASVLGGTLRYVGSAQGAVNAGSYDLSASGLTSGNYDISYVDGTLTVNKAALTVTANNDTKTYDGVAYAGGNGVSYSGFVNGESASVLGGALRFGGSAQGAVNAGSYGLSASGLTSGNYDISYVDGTLTVNKAALTVTANNDTKSFDGSVYANGNGVSYAGFVNGETAAVLSGTLTYGGSAQGAVDIGTYLITASGLSANNYVISFVDGTLAIRPPSAAMIPRDPPAATLFVGESYRPGSIDKKGTNARPGSRCVGADCMSVPHFLNWTPDERIVFLAY